MVTYLTRPSSELRAKWHTRENIPRISWSAALICGAVYSNNIAFPSIFSLINTPSNKVRVFTSSARVTVVKIGAKIIFEFFQYFSMDNS